MSLYAFDFREELYGPWETARAALIEQLDLLYAGLNAATIGRTASGQGATIGGSPLAGDVVNRGSGGTGANNWNAATDGNVPTRPIALNSAVGATLFANATISSVRCNTISSVPLEIIPAPGAGKIIIPLWAAHYTLQGPDGLFNNTTTAALRYGVTAGGGGGAGQNDLIVFNSFITGSGVTQDRWTYAGLNVAYVDRNAPASGGGSPENKSLYFRGSADNTGGDNKSTIVTRLRVAYAIIGVI